MNVEPGQIFGDWTVIECLTLNGIVSQRTWKVKCKCGVMSKVKATRLVNGYTKHCVRCGFKVRDARRRDRSSLLHETHPLYDTWRTMIQRCTNPNKNNYHNYGGRGINVCDRWLKGFKYFLEDMGEKPDPKLTLERIDNDGDYTPLNCTWATRSQQMQNTR